jgi:hypothetical protein
MRILLRILLVVTFAFLAAAASHAAQWARTYGGASGFGAASMELTADGGYVLVGSTRARVGANAEVWALKLVADGNVAWQKTYGGDRDLYASAIQPLADGGYVVGGSYNAVSAGYGDAFIMKLDAAGAVAWHKRYVGTGDDSVSAIQATDDRGFIVAGNRRRVLITAPPGSPPHAQFFVNAWVLKLDNAGNAAWERNFGESSQALAVHPTVDGGYILVGSAYVSHPSTYTNPWIVRLDANGDVLWERSYASPHFGVARSVHPTADGGYVVAGESGETGSPDSGDTDAFVLRLDANGQVIWKSAYGGPRNDAANSVHPTPDGGYVVAGGTDSFHPSTLNAPNAWVLKLTADGGIVWQEIFGGPKLFGVASYAVSARATAVGDLVVAGYTGTYDSQGEAFVLRVSGSGGIAACPDLGPSSATVRTSSATLQNYVSSFPTNDARLVDSFVSVANGTATERARCPCGASITAVEYYHHDFNHYFLTALSVEIAALDAGMFAGWARSGRSFQVYPIDAYCSAANVCRFWSGRSFAPKSSHFYTPYATECAYLQQQGVWQYEGDAFALVMPAGSAGQGNCRPPTQPLYRAYNNGMSGAPNHRYMTDPALLDEMIAQGWIMEGEAATRVFACVPAP